MRELRLTRVRGVPLAGETLGFAELDGARLGWSALHLRHFLTVSHFSR